MPLSFSELSGRYNELWRETSALYEAWARQNGLSYHELLVVLSIAQARGAVYPENHLRAMGRAKANGAQRPAGVSGARACAALPGTGRQAQ